MERVVTVAHDDESGFRGYVQVYTGSGKGKTTAALGLTMRASGAGLRVYFCQFLKGRLHSEILTLRDRFPDVKVEQFGSGKFVRGRPSQEDIDSARDGMEALNRALMCGKYDVVVADELNIAVSLRIISAGEVVTLIESKPVSVELIITGRNADAAVLDAADLVTEMTEIRHYYHSGVKARRGIES